jgi:hypothetical protein
LRALFDLKAPNGGAKFSELSQFDVGLRRESPDCLAIKRLPINSCGERPRVN